MRAWVLHTVHGVTAQNGHGAGVLLCPAGRDSAPLQAPYTLPIIASASHCFGSGTATTLSMLARGEDTDPVKNRALPKAIGCGKNLQWVERSMGGVQKWLE